MGGQVSTARTRRATDPFRLLFAGQALSVVGDRITPVAVAFAVLGLGDASDLGLVLAAGGIPFALFAVAGGVVSDRVGRRQVMIVSDVVRAVTQAVVAFLLISGAAEVWMLVALSAVYGTAAAVFMPALMGLIPETVEVGRLQQANALLGVTRSVATVAGPALAGIIIALGGPGDAIALDALTFVASAGCLLALRPRRAPAASSEPDAPFAARLREGWAEVRSRRWLRTGLVAMAAYNVFVLPAVYVLGPALAARELSGASSWAVIVACFGVGTVLGNLAALRVTLRRPLLVAASALVAAATQGAIIGSGMGTGGIAALELLAGACVSLFFTLWDTSIQQTVPAHAVSRVSSYDFAVSMGLMPLGMAVAGPIAARAGLQPTLIGMSALGVLAALAWLLSGDVRSVRRTRPPDAADLAGQAPGGAVPAFGGAAHDAAALRADGDERRFGPDPRPRPVEEV